MILSKLAVSSLSAFVDGCAKAAAIVAKKHKDKIKRLFMCRKFKGYKTLKINKGVYARPLFFMDGKPAVGGNAKNKTGLQRRVGRYR